MISQSAKDNLIVSQLFQNIASQYLNFTKHEVKLPAEKTFIDQLNGRLTANKRHFLSVVGTEQGRVILQRELSKRDALQYANIMLMIFELDNEKRDTIEKLVTTIYKGEIVEFVAPPETNLTAKMEDEGDEHSIPEPETTNN